MALLEAVNVTKRFTIESGVFRASHSAVLALDSVSLRLEQGKVLGVIGESGSGKTTLGRIICRLIAPDSGEVLVDGENIRSLGRKELAASVQMIFQDPFASLNPKLTIRTILSEPVLDRPRAQQNEALAETLSTVGLSTDILGSYPHQFSGGQRQRIAIARALLKKPRIIIADEPLSALDVSIQNQLLGLFLKLKETHALSFVFISHDLVTASDLADYLIVMKNGTIVEEGATSAVIARPSEEYTRKLLSAVPRLI